MKRAKPQKKERTDGLPRAIVRLERCGYEVEGSGTAKPDGCPVCPRHFADVSQLCSTNVEELRRRQSRQNNPSARDGIRYDEIFRAFLDELGSSEESIAAIENSFAFEQEAV